MRRLFAAALFVVIAGLSSQAAAADFGSRDTSAGRDIWDGILSDLDARSCEDPYVLDMISERFRHQAFNVHDAPTLRIADYYNIHEHRYVPYGEDQPIARRYCGATVVLTDAYSNEVHKREMWYLIEDRMGFVGLGDNVEFCIAGFDRWHVYSGRCRVLRPGLL
jgi:hypothetical protein